MNWCLPKQTRDDVLGWADMPIWIWDSLAQGHQMLVLEEFLKRHGG